MVGLHILIRGYDMILCDTMPITYHQESMLNSKFMNSILTIKHNATPISVVTHIIEDYKKLSLETPDIILIILINEFSVKIVFRKLNIDCYVKVETINGLVTVEL